MPFCVALGCSNVEETSGISFHRFPENPQIQLAWTKAGRLKMCELTNQSMLCSAHFREQDLYRTSPNSVEIREGAIPSIFPADSQQLQKDGLLQVSDHKGLETVVSISPVGPSAMENKIQYLEKVGLSQKVDQKEYAVGILPVNSPALENKIKSIETEIKQEPVEADETTIYSCVAATLENTPSVSVSANDGGEHSKQQPSVCNKCGLVLDETDRLRGHFCNNPDLESQVKAVLALTQLKYQFNNAESMNNKKLCLPPKHIINEGGNRLLVNKRSTKDGPSIFRCDICEKLYSSRQSLRSHMVTHSESAELRQFMCGQCGKAFKSKQSLVLHESTHLGIMYKCSECEKSFTTARSLATHKLGHTGERPFCCEQCGKTYSQKASLRVHLRSHRQDKPFKCTVCEKAFYMSGSLTDHMRVHTNEKPYICETCGKGFSQKTQLTAHQWTHSDVKPHKCSVCEMTFAQRRNLIDHELIHFDLKPFTCDDCGKSFRRKTHLNGHKCKVKKAKMLQMGKTDEIGDNKALITPSEHLKVEPI